jgi:FKBP-type peptidyl-prolyl cis-trans isomerase 2
MSKKQVVTETDGVIVHFKGRFEDGSEFSSKADGGPLEFSLGRKMVIKGLEDAVLGMKVGEKKKVTITPKDAFGEHDEELVKKVSISKLGLEEEPKVGMILQMYDESIESKEEEDKIINAKIIDIDGDVMTIDYNHPLAGKTLTMQIELVDIVK